MLIHPVKASEWFSFSTQNRDILKRIGGLPVNDVFYSLFYDDSAIKLLRGSRGGGKSEITCDVSLNNCMNDPYFKCYYGRKVYDTIRGSSFATLVACIEKNNLQHKFHYSTANTSSMIITCKSNGNSFIPFGADKVDKLKSIKDPTVIWCEEFDQFEFEDFKELYPTLRTTRGRNEFWGTFNAYAVYETHWILQVFFPELYKGEEKIEFEILNKDSITSILANYTDNYFIDQEDYKKKLILASGGNQTIFDGIANGAWGVTDNKNPWLYNFVTETHVKDSLPFLPSYPVYISFDFNNDPFACTAWQMSPSKGSQTSFIHCIKEFSGMIKIEEMCQRIRATYPNSILYVTGDRSGQNEDVGRNQTLYQMISGYLGINDKLLNLNTTNLEHSDSRIFLNALLANHPNLFFSREGCPELIRQCQRAKVDEESKKPSHLLKDRGQYKNDEFDSMRYFFQTYFHKWAKETYLKALHKS